MGKGGNVRRAWWGRLARVWGLPVLLVALGASAAEASPFAYVTNQTPGTVSVIDTATNTVVATVTVQAGPPGVAITPNGAFAYVVNAGSNTVSVIETATNTVAKTVTVGNGPFGVAITPNGAFAYVANGNSNTVSVIDTATKTVAAMVAVGAAPYGVAITPNGAFAYVTNSNSGTVSVIDTATNTVVGAVTGMDDPVGVAITPDGAFAYVANFLSDNVSVISTATNAVVAAVQLLAGSGPLGVAITSFSQEPFTAFSAKVDINLASPSFEVNSTFTLGTGGSISPLSQAVKVQVGSFSTTIPAGSFQLNPQGKFVFEGIIDGVALEANLTPLGGNSFSFKIQGSGALNLPTSNPVPVVLTIGNNTGSVTVDADFQ